MNGNRNKLKLNNKGFTLIELMVTVFLIVIVLSTVYGMMSAGNRIFAQGDAKADIQSNLRLSGNFISDKIRYASKVTILDSLPDPDDLGSNREYIYATSDGALKYYDGDTTQDVPGALEGVLSTLYFENKNSETVMIKINGKFRDQNYEVQTAAFLLNYGDDALAEANGPVIAFSPGNPVKLNVNGNRIERITINTLTGERQIPIDGQVDLVADVRPDNVSKKTVGWYFVGGDVENATVQSITETAGRLTFNGMAAESGVTVYAKALDGFGVESNHITITATESAIVEATNVEVIADYPYIFQKGGVVQMKAIVTPENATNRSVEWSIPGREGAATIENNGNNYGTLTTLGDNTSKNPITVKATLGNGTFGEKDIYIVDNIESMQLKAENGVTTGNGANRVYTTNVKCFLNSGSNLATLSKGVVSIGWSCPGKPDNLNITLSEKDGSVDITVKGHKNSTAQFNLTAIIKPISGNSQAETITVYVP